MVVDALLRRLWALPDPETPWLSEGTAGLALVHAVLAAERPGSGHEARSRALLVRTTELLEDSEAVAGLWTGLAGVGWVFERLRAPDEDPCEVVDELLIEAVRDWPEGDPLDWIAGLSGIAAYAEARRPRPAATALLETIVDTLRRHAEPGGGGVLWVTTPAWVARGDRGRVDLGLAHGQPGVLAALGIAAQAGVSGAAPLLEAGLAGTFGVIPSDRPLPAWVGGQERSGRLDAWCYGPAGAGAALLRLGGRLGRPELVRRGREMVRLALNAPATEQAPGGLCHGQASVLAIARVADEPDAVARWTGIVEAQPEASGAGLLDGLEGQILALSPGLDQWRDLLAI